MARAMNRNGKAGPQPLAPLGDAAANDPLQGGLAIGRQILSSSLVTAQSLVAWAEEAQRLNKQGLQDCEQALAGALHDAGQATNLPQLLAVATQLAGRQWALAMEQFAAGASQCLEGELQLADRLRSEALELARHLVPDGAAAAPAPGTNADLDPLGQFSQMQDEWLAASQRWIDSVKAGALH